MAEETLLSMYLIKYTLRQHKENKIEKYSVRCFQVSNKNIVEWHPSIIFLVICVKVLGIK